MSGQSWRLDLWILYETIRGIAFGKFRRKRHAARLANRMISETYECRDSIVEAKPLPSDAALPDPLPRDVEPVSHGDRAVSRDRERVGALQDVTS